MKKLNVLGAVIMLAFVGCKGPAGENGANGTNGSPGVPGLDGPVMTKYVGDIEYVNQWVSVPELTEDSLVSVYWSPDGKNGARWLELGSPQASGVRYSSGNLTEKRIYFYNMTIGDGYAVIIFN